MTSKTTCKRQKYIIVSLFFVGIFPFIINGIINPLLQRTPVLYWIFEFISWIAIPLFIVIYSTRNIGFKFYEIGINSYIFEKKNKFIVIIIGIIISPFVLYFYKLSYLIGLSLFENTVISPHKSFIPESGILRFIALVYFAVTAGIVEEIYYRGFAYKIASYYKNKIFIYLILSPFLFSLVHWEGGLGKMFATYLLGILLSGLFLVLKNLWPLIIAHIYTDLSWFFSLG